MVFIHEKHDFDAQKIQKQCKKMSFGVFYVKNGLFDFPSVF